MTVTVTVHDTAGVVAAVEEGRAQLGVAGAVPKGAKATFEQLTVDELVAICPPASPLRLAQGVRLADLAEQDWVAREPGSGTRVMAERELAAEGVDVGEPAVVAQLGTGEAIVSAIEGGLGIAMVSKYVARQGARTRDGLRGSTSRARASSGRSTRVLPKGTPTRAAAAFNAHLHALLEG